MRSEVTIYCAVCANAVENCCCHMPVVRSRQPAQPVAVNTVQDAARVLLEAMKGGLDPLDAFDPTIVALAVKHAGNRGDGVIQLEIAEEFFTAALRAIAEAQQ